MKRKLNKALVDQRFQTRRQFLIGGGQTLLALPLLTSLLPRDVLAQVTASPVVRYFGMLGFLGIDYHQWTPVDQTNLTMVPGEDSIGYKPLSQFSGPISRVIDSSFQDLYADMNVISGLSLTGGLYQGHNESVLSGTHSGGRSPIYGKSLDVVIEKSPNVYKAGQSVSRKAIRVHDGSHLTGFSFDRLADGTRVVSPQLQGDLALFNALMTSLGTGGGTTTGPTQQQVNRGLIVDQVFQDLKALEGSSRISANDKQTLDRYISGIVDLQKKVAANNTPPPASCVKPTMSLEVDAQGNFYQFPTTDSRWGVQSIDKMYDNYIEIFRIAAMCDLTRVFHWAMSAWDDQIVPGGVAGGLHHEAPSSDVQADRQQYGIKKLAKLARALKSTPDPISGGNLLDNSIVLYANELGAWTTAHNTFNMPTITFGKGGGKLTSGNFIDCRQRPLQQVKGFYPGRPYKQFLQAVMMAMGVTQAEYSQFGDGNGYGEFKEMVNQFGLNVNLFGRYKNVHNNPLPFFYK